MPTLAAAINFFPNRRVCSLTASWQREVEQKQSQSQESVAEPRPGKGETDGRGDVDVGDDDEVKLAQKVVVKEATRIGFGRQVDARVQGADSSCRRFDALQARGAAG